MRRNAAPRLPFLLLFLTAGCALFGGEDDPSISLTASATTAVLQQGASQSITLQIARKNFDQPVVLSVEGPLPAGVSSSFAPNPVPASASSALLTITASGTAIPGLAALTVKATGEGSAESAVLIDVTVNIRGSHSVTLADANMKVAQGGAGRSTVVLARQGSNAGIVTLTATGAPAGMTVLFGESPTTGGATSVAVAASASVAPGAYGISISGSQPGLTPTPAPAVLTVTVIPPPPTAAMTIPFCANEMPSWFAYQNEGFLWQAATPSGSSFNFAATDKVSVAFAYASGAASTVRFYSATRPELAGITGLDCPGPKNHPGTTANVGAGQIGIVSLGGAFDVVSGNSFLLEGVADQPLDLVGARGVVSNGQFTADRMVVRRGVNVANNASISLVDYMGAESVTPVTHTLTVGGVEPSETVYMENVFRGTSGTLGLLGTSQSTLNTHTLLFAPPSSLVAGDLHELYVDAFNSQGTVAHTMVTYLSAPGDRTETLGPLLSTPTVSAILVAPYLRERVQLASQSEYPTAARFVFRQGATASKDVEMVVTAAYLGATPATWDLLVPDVSYVTGFNTAWMHSSGPVVTHSAEAFSAPGAVLFGAQPSAGQTVKLAYREATAPSAVSPALRLSSARKRSLGASRRGLLHPAPQYLRR